MHKILLLAIFVFHTTLVFAQKGANPYKINEAKGLLGDRCKEYREIVKDLPADVRYDIMVQDGEIYLLLPDKETFQKLFDHYRDGIAVDIIHKDQFSCGKENDLGDGWPNRGYLMAPMYKKQMEENLAYDDFNDIVIKYGPLPAQFNPADIELNILTLQKNALCSYNSIANIEYTNWDLLETGLYQDSIPKAGKEQETYTLTKTIKFTIPFKKNKIKFVADDIRPLYDSPELTDFDIMEIAVQAFTSVEGSTEQNIKLQEGRAQSIVDALQEYQRQEIKTNISTTENWAQFAEDISGTRFQYLKSFSKEKIKKVLAEDKELLRTLEPLLEKQRKGIVRLVLQKKLSVYEDDPEKLKADFSQSLSGRNLEEALFLQYLIFDQVRGEKLPDEFISQLEIPEESELGPLFNNIVLFGLERQNKDLYQTIQEFERLQTFIPDNPKIKYNIAALKIRAWSEGSSPDVNRQAIEKLLHDLGKTNIHPSLTERLRINYFLLLTQYLTFEKKYKEKRKSVKSIYHHYRKVDMDDAEALSIARFLAFYSEFKMATDVLSPRVKSENVSEDVLFYYLKLTITEPRNTRSSEYSKIIGKAISMNKERYCKMFLPKAQGGYTFQLKDDAMLKDSYCENCSGVIN